jgi:hypothetical protein
MEGSREKGRMKGRKKGRKEERKRERKGRDFSHLLSLRRLTLENL